ncbi:MAG: hypothetical protein HZA92_09055 [Verrucomicrobia bacterium]|nr:hypothetical protein [Verrucomicrobiota bacterium]
MRNHMLLLLVTGLAVAGCKKKPAAPATPPPAPAGVTSAAPAQKDPDLTALNAAYKKFWQEKQSPPAKLEDLVKQKYLSSLPVPPPGKKFNVDWSKMEVTLINQ